MAPGPAREVREPTRGKILNTVKGSAAAGGVSIVALAAYLIPWTQAQSAEVSGLRADAAVTKAATTQCTSDLRGVRRDVEDLKARQSAAEATVTSIAARLDRIETKLDRLLERK